MLATCVNIARFFFWAKFFPSWKLCLKLQETYEIPCWESSSRTQQVFMWTAQLHESLLMQGRQRCSSVPGAVGVSAQVAAPRIQLPTASNVCWAPAAGQPCPAGAAGWQLHTLLSIPSWSRACTLWPCRGPPHPWTLISKVSSHKPCWAHTEEKQECKSVSGDKHCFKNNNKNLNSSPVVKIEVASGSS